MLFAVILLQSACCAAPVGDDLGHCLFQAFNDFGISFGDVFGFIMLEKTIRALPLFVVSVRVPLLSRTRRFRCQMNRCGLDAAFLILH